MDISRLPNDMSLLFAATRTDVRADLNLKINQINRQSTSFSKE